MERGGRGHGMDVLDGYVIQWDLWVELAGHLAWPLVVIAVLLTFRRPLRDLLTKADSVEVGGVKISSKIKALNTEVTEGLKEADARLTQKEEEVTEAAEEPLPPDMPLSVDQQRIQAGWTPVEDAFDFAFDEIARVRGADAVPRLARTYRRQGRFLLSSNQMVLEGWISFELRDAIKALLDVRDSVSNLDVKVTEADAQVFARNCQKTAQSIRNAVRYRLRPQEQPAATTPR